jgi:hypothetical protein
MFIKDGKTIFTREAKPGRTKAVGCTRHGEKTVTTTAACTAEVVAVCVRCGGRVEVAA